MPLFFAILWTVIGSLFTAAMFFTFLDSLKKRHTDGAYIFIFLFAAFTLSMMFIALLPWATLLMGP